jgi:hypothetical protein
MTVTDAPGWLTDADLAEPVRQRVGDFDAAIADWSCHALTGGSSNGEGVWRIAGTSLSGEVSRPWSLILKGWPPPAPDQAEFSMGWPLREADLYRSGLLDDLPGGIAAPICFGHLRRPDGTVWVWLEDVRDDAGGAWPLVRFASHARQLGRFNGAWAAGRPLPELACQSRGWIRERVATAAPFIEQLSQLADRPLVRQVYPPAVAAAWQRMWDHRERWCAALDRLPQTFCHMDAFPRNAFTRPDPNGRDQTVLIDWAFAGIAALGEELTSPIVASVMFMEVPIDDARQLEAVSIEAYFDGLRDAGWRGDPDGVRQGYAVAAALRYGVGGMGRWVPVLLDERFHPIAERVLGHPFEEAVATSAAVQRWLADLVPDP